MKKYMKQIVVLLLVSFSLVNCGGGGSSEGTFDTGDLKVNLPTCQNGTIQIQENDLLVKDTSGTVITITHLSNNTKEVCTQSGSAHIIRKN